MSDTNFKPTLNKPTSELAKGFEKTFNKTMEKNNVVLNEDDLLNEEEKILKKKIFSLPKMEALVFSDPKLNAEYDKMNDLQDRTYLFGYHANETILNSLFNDYVLNSPKYLQKYKQAVPKEKKRRDKSGINQLKKAGEEIMIKRGEKPIANTEKSVDEITGAGSSGAFSAPLGMNKQIDETTTASSAGGAAGYVGYAGPAAWSKNGKPAANKPLYKGGQVIQESNYLIDPSGFEKFLKILNEDQSYNEISKDYKETHTGSNKGLGVSEIPQTPERTKKISKIDDNTSLYTGQDVGNMRDKDVDILHNDMIEPHSYFPHPQNKNLKDDGIQGSLKEDTKIEDEDITYIKKNTDEYGDLNNVNKNNLNIMKKDIKTQELDKPDLKTEGIDEKAVSKAQQKFMGMVHAVQKGVLSPDKVGGKVEKAAETMKPKDVKDFAATKTKKLPEKLNESLQDTVEYVSDRQGEEPFMLGGIKWQFVNAKYPNGKVDIGVYRVDHDLVYDYNWWRQAMNIDKNNNIKEDTQTMIQSNGTSMSNKSTATGDQSSNMDMGMNSSMNESEKLLEELNNELNAFSIYHDKLKIMSEDRKPSSLILKDRLGSENEKNFKKDLKDSSVSKLVNIENALEYKSQQTEIKDPQKLNADLEKKTLENTKGVAFKNVGNSENDKGDEIPKRNMTTEEQDEVNNYRLGLGDFVYDNKPNKKFEDRMKADMGDKLYQQRQDKLEFRGKAPMYNKDAQPTDKSDTGKVQFDKEKSGWNERQGLKESEVIGKYFNKFGKKTFVDFKLNEVKEITDLNTELFELSLDGLGNTYTSKVDINEDVVKAMNENKFYTNGTDVFVMKNQVQSLNESENKVKKPINEEFNKMKHLLNYNPNDFTDTSNNSRF